MELYSAAVPIMLLQLIPHARAQFQALGMPGMQGMPGMPNMPGMMGMPPMSMPMPMPMMAHQKMPVVVMPYHSKTADSFRRRRKKKQKRIQISASASQSDSGSNSEAASGEPTFRASRSGSKKRRRQVLTPVISYVTKDGYVVYQKKIKKDRAKEWLDLGKKSSDSGPPATELELSEEKAIRELKKKYGRRKRRQHDRDSK